jgi:hypothetical protein
VKFFSFKSSDQHVCCIFVEWNTQLGKKDIKKVLRWNVRERESERERERERDREGQTDSTK